MKTLKELIDVHFNYSSDAREKKRRTGLNDQLLEYMASCWELEGPNGVFTRIDEEKVQQLFGESAAGIVGRSVFDFMTPETRDKAMREYQENYRNGKNFSNVEWFFPGPISQDLIVASSSAVFFVEPGMAGYWGMGRNVTGEFRMRKEMEYMSTHDPDTGLNNKAYFLQKLECYSKSERAGDFPLAILVVDANRFKQVNDTLGHSVGDEAIRKIADKLKENLREEDLVGRYGGDEFVVLMPGKDREQAEVIRERIEKRTVIDMGMGVEVTVSVGVNVCERPEQFEKDGFFRKADADMYRRKEDSTTILKIRSWMIPSKREE